MYTSDTNKECGARAKKTALVYLGFSLFLALFGAVYELYSHEVYSYWMIYAFAFPLVFGTLAFLLLGMKKEARYPSKGAARLWHSGVATLTCGSLVRGALAIYGTTNDLIHIFPPAGAALLAAAVVLYILCGKKKAGEKEQDTPQ